MSEEYLVPMTPLEEITLPSTLDGSQGKNRSHESSLLTAQHDMQAIELWLSRLDKDSHTYRAYRREAERILLWAIVDRGKAFSSLHTIDMSDYRRFLLDPRPVEQWIGSPQKKGHADWRPFTGPLSERSTRYAETVLNALFSWLVDQHYLQTNPMKGMPKLSRTKQQLDINRSFSKSEWKLIKDYLAEKISSSEQKTQIHYSRIHLILSILYATGLRLHELAKIVIGDIVKVERNGNTQYWLKIIGKGNKYREVPVPSTLIQIIDEIYYKLTGESWRTVPKTLPLIPRIRAQSALPLKPLAIHKVLKAFFAEIAVSLSETDVESSEKLTRASTHWLRHTHGTHAVDMDIALTVVRDNLGHSSIAITSQYVHADKDARHSAISEMLN
jgi:site-specific recombinase XerD